MWTCRIRIVAQFYSINVDASLYYFHGGMQDNGSWRGLNRVCWSRGVRNVYWEKIRFGDGFDMVPDSENSRYSYSIWKCGNLMRYIAKTGDFEYIRPKPDSVTDPTEGQFYFNWNAAVAQSLHDPNTVYYGSQHVHRSTKTLGRSSPGPDTNNPERQKLRQRAASRKT